MSKQAVTVERADSENKIVDPPDSKPEVTRTRPRSVSGRIPRLPADSTVSLRLGTVVLLGVVFLLVLTTAAFGWIAHERGGERDSARAEVTALRSAAADDSHAEKVAGDYSVGAAQMDFKDLAAWSQRLTANTSPELSNKLKQAAASMEQVIVPLQWVSIPTPITAKVRSQQNGVFVVTCFVSVMTKNTQAPDGVQSTATYTVTIDKNAGWKITDVGGIDSAMSGK